MTGFRILRASPFSSQTDLSSVDIGRLRVGATLHSPILDSNKILLLAANSVITETTIERLRQRGLTRVLVSRAELSRICISDGSRPTARDSFNSISAPSARSAPARESAQQASQSPAGTAKAREASAQAAPSWGDPEQGVLKKRSSAPATAYDPVVASRFQKENEAAVARLGMVYEESAQLKNAELELMAGISEVSLSQMIEDFDLYVSQGLAPEKDCYPARHGQHTAMIAMATAARLNLPKSELISLGVGCMAHDIGMLHLKMQFHAEDQPMTASRFLEVTRHPGISLDMMRDARQTAAGARIVVYQMHERMNGTGYPRNRKRDQIHPLARIATVADVFTAMVSPRPHRQPVLPYVAMERILKGSQEGAFDRDVVRALLQAVSLFPVGSCVELNDGRVGQVLRANTSNYMRPVVQLWSPEAVGGAGEVVDMSHAPELSVMRPIPDLAPEATMSAHITVQASI